MTSLDLDSLPAGCATTIALPLPALPSGSVMTLPVRVLRGAEPGAVGWISAAVHGDEINGTEIVRRLLARLDPARLRGTLLLLPVVDVYGFDTSTRGLPDRRDLNRSFPGSARGSLTARLAHLFVSAIVDACDFGIDLHTGSAGRANLPQVRGEIDNERFMSMARTFAPPLIVASPPLDNSLRACCSNREVDYLLYEAGEAGRFDERAVVVGVEGCLGVLASRGLWCTDHAAASLPEIAIDCIWLRAARSGVFVPTTELGAHVTRGMSLGSVSNAFGDEPSLVEAPFDGIVIGLTVTPLVESGSALFHLARLVPRPDQGC